MVVIDDTSLIVFNSFACMLIALKILILFSVATAEKGIICLTALRNERKSVLKGAVGSADLKISESALLSLNHHNFSNTKPIYTE